MYSPIFIRKRLEDCVLTKVAEKADVPYKTLNKWMGDKDHKPSYELINKLSAYIDGVDKGKA